MNRFVGFCIFLLCGALAYSQKYEPEWVGEVVLLSIGNDTTAMRTEKSFPQVKTSSSAGQILVGIGNIRQKAVIKNGRSTTQVSAGDNIALVVRWRDNDIDPATFIQLVKFEEKKKERRTELANINWLGNVSEGNMEFVEFFGKRYGNTSYILTFPMVEGEYGVRVLNPNENDEKPPVFYCFGIHND